MKKTIVLLVVLLLLATTTQVAFANPDPPNTPPTRGACHMDVSFWAPGTGPGNAYGVQPGERGMYRVHMSHPLGKYTNGAHNMDAIYIAHCLK